MLLGSVFLPSTIGITEYQILPRNKPRGGYIQGLIDNATAGDTIYIPSGIYNESIIINKSLNLVGEDKNTTIIQHQGPDSIVIDILADWVTIKNFTIQGYGWFSCGINLHSNFSTIQENIIIHGEIPSYAICSSGKFNKIIANTITNVDSGIWFGWSENNIISDNNISVGWRGIVFSNNNSNNYINNNIISGGLGISFEGQGYKINNTVINNIIHGWGVNSGGYCVSFSYGAHNIIESNTISNNTEGIHIEDSYNITIIDNIISNNKDGIYLQNTSNITITKNNICKNDWGITILGAHLASITNNTIVNNIGGICFEWLGFSKISHNVLRDNYEVGIGIGFESGYNSVNNNTIFNGDSGLWIEGGNIGSPRQNLIENNSFFNTGIFAINMRWSYNTFINNNVNGKPLIFWENTSDMVVDNAGQILLYYCKNITIQNQEICNTTVGIYGEGCQNCHILNNNISSNSQGGLKIGSCYEFISDNNVINNNVIINNNGNGITYQGDNTIISSNILTENNGTGICLSDAYGNSGFITINNNMIRSNEGTGIILVRYNNITISNNDITENKIHGIEIQRSPDNDIVDNDISSNNLYGIIISDSTCNTLQDNSISNNGVLGIYLSDSNNNTIIKNGITLNYEEGLYFLKSNHNVILENTISENEEGIKLDDSSNNTFQNNNCLRNTRHVLFVNCNNIWNQNYWDRPRILPKLIFGKISIGPIEIPWFNIDWDPAFIPYNIGV
jgi:parallel beta-helix repeat protein